MSITFRVAAAAIGAAALVGAVGVDVAPAGTFPKSGSYHDGGEGATVEPAPDPTTLKTASFSPQIRAKTPCGATPWGGGCG
ncbi:hypothetical protein [Mycolicibacterium vaccae]|uniref:Uncharacterized protein n=1 Tax=Mycolicibacterium vaccae ATCC 25954 TaxID=1194972 RepID=K0UMR2_MYCVA|nr:hypothetical protein [Mycolicibacterium vaccae]ANI40758.1 hypothetical protein MYVA_3633 [Mycolicibacterium vaccae 95051]EJZ08116.1 hypothetical protein MVAC_16675 [Mycolicibacterium vaccae ATCC 25954]MCV7061365.1 hypothetical protein [Mycolicibacterium vaccae]